MTASVDLERARAVADAVLYEGYLLYPYRASAGKNQSRWQFGVLGPHGAAQAGVGEESGLQCECLFRHSPDARVTVWLRFLQLQAREVEAVDGAGRYAGVPELRVDGQRWLSWDEAVEHEVSIGPVTLTELDAPFEHVVTVEGGSEASELSGTDAGTAGRVVRRRWPLSGLVRLQAAALPEQPGVSRLRMEVENLTVVPSPPDKAEAVRRSFLGAHLLLGCDDGVFVSLTDPPTELAQDARTCRQRRTWPVLAGPPGRDDVLLVSPIILEDHPSLAKESPGSLFDSTEIDEILTLRILTMTPEEKAEARATDPRAAGIIDRSESLSAEQMSGLHATMHDPHALREVVIEPTADEPLGGIATWPTAAEPSTDTPWWDPERDGSVDPATDAITIAGTSVRRGSLVVVRPSRRADAQDLFFAGQTGRVTGVHFDVDGATHVSVVLVDDPAADLHDWYGRYLYFDPDELEPLGSTAAGSQAREETRS